MYSHILLTICYLVDRSICNNYKKDWDLSLAFIGSIIGGVLTLIGVKWTLDNQK